MENFRRALSYLWGNDIREASPFLPPPDSPLSAGPQPGQKRKGTAASPQKSKARRLTRTRAQAIHRDIDQADFYEGWSRRKFLARGQSTHSTSTITTPQRRPIRRPTTLTFKGARLDDISENVDEIKEKIDELPVSEGEKDEVREKVAHEFLLSPTTGRSLPVTPRTVTSFLPTTPATPLTPLPPNPRTPRTPVAQPFVRTPKPTKPPVPKPRGPNVVRGDWTTTPNQRASDILYHMCGGDRSKAAYQVKVELDRAQPSGKPEPLYSFRDVEIRDGIWQVMDKIQRFARVHFDFKFQRGVGEVLRNEDKLNTAFASMVPETVKLIGCVASGGPSGAEGWRDLFYDRAKRRALVCAMIGNVLTEQVYQHGFFGGSSAQEEHIDQLQFDHRHDDGFDRNRLYAEYIADQLKIKRVHDPPPRRDFDAGSLTLPNGFDSHVKAIVEALQIHLSPIYKLHKSNFTIDMVAELYKIVTRAGILSLLMRADPHTVYYFTPVFKEDRYQSKFMECFNRAEMEQTHPRERKSPSSWTDAEKQRAKGDEALNQITLMDGVTAYRRGGWETAESTIDNPKYEDKNENKGIRSRVLSHSWVYCRWGRARKFEKGKPADDPKVHGMQWSGKGFIEFEQVPGVPKKKVEKPTGKGKGKEKAV